MRTITTTEAKARFNALLAEVAQGETITITNHGRAVAIVSKAEPGSRTFGRFAGEITIPDDFNEPISESDLVLWGETDNPQMGSRPSLRHEEFGLNGRTS